MKKSKFLFIVILSLVFIFGTILINASELSPSSGSKYYKTSIIHFNDLDDSIKNSIIEFIEENNATIASPSVTVHHYRQLN